jgi:hypothetical protein
VFASLRLAILACFAALLPLSDSGFGPVKDADAGDGTVAPQRLSIPAADSAGVIGSVEDCGGCTFTVGVTGAPPPGVGIFIGSFPPNINGYCDYALSPCQEIVGCSLSGDLTVTIFLQPGDTLQAEFTFPVAPPNVRGKVTNATPTVTALTMSVAGAPVSMTCGGLLPMWTVRISRGGTVTEFKLWANCNPCQWS